MTGEGFGASHHAGAAAEDAGDERPPPRLDKGPPQDAVGHVGEPEGLVVAVPQPEHTSAQQEERTGNCALICITHGGSSKALRQHGSSEAVGRTGHARQQVQRVAQQACPAHQGDLT